MRKTNRNTYNPTIRNKLAEKKQKIPCIECGKMFAPYMPNTKFCSPECRTHYNNTHRAPKKKLVYKLCNQCGAAYTPRSNQQVYCSDKCRQEARKKNEVKLKVPKKLKICGNCSKEFETSHQYKTYCCKECAMQAKKDYYKRMRNNEEETPYDERLK
jgi:hypothetical protein